LTNWTLWFSRDRNYGERICEEVSSVRVVKPVKTRQSGLKPYSPVLSEQTKLPSEYSSPFKEIQEDLWA
jgi:hypothetical protein